MKGMPNEMDEKSMTRCIECRAGELRILGTGFYGDTVEVECQNCGEIYEVEPDGPGMAGEEWAIAKMKDLEKENPPLMKCGHIANARSHEGWLCSICWFESKGTNQDAITVKEPDHGTV